MKFVFIDETEKLGHFGICAIVLDSSKYLKTSKSLLNILNKAKWGLNFEFKSIYIFSSSKGDQKISVKNRMKMAKRMIQTNLSKSNASFSVFFSFLKGSKSAENYEKLIAAIFKKLPKAQTSKGGKNLVCLYFDHTGFAGNELAAERISAAFKELSKKNYYLVEYPSSVHSSNHTAGIMLADHLAFICMWNNLHKHEQQGEKPEIRKIKIVAL